MSRSKKRRSASQGQCHTSQDKQIVAKNIGRLLVMIAATAIIYGVYRFMLTQPYFEIVLGIYLAAATAAILGYVIYNRGFSRSGITRDMLPDTMSEEQKDAFIEDAKRRSERSRWLLIIAFAFLFTFAFDAFELFVLDGLRGL